ncbi:MAG TPA: hypothetical protein VLW50_25750 [Streptosporangiaceae bacterium]|nr:hypothetical protein [Streptosporangiaceae bacterium]
MESIHDKYADSPRKQRRYATEHGGEWRDDDGLTHNMPGENSR